MDVFLLGAGKPARGDSPSALKKIASDMNVMDWQIRCFQSASLKTQIHYLGGYHVSEVIERYPQLNVSVVPDWNEKNILHTFFQAPFSESDAIFSYSDTIFRREVVEKLLAKNSDLVLAVDTLWEQRYSERSKADIQSAEKLDLNKFIGQSTNKFPNSGIVEFTGLMWVSSRVLRFLEQRSQSNIGENLLDLINFLNEQKFKIDIEDVAGNWAELNSPFDLAHFILGTKAETLERLEPVVKKSFIGHQYCFTVQDWQKDEIKVLDETFKEFSGNALVVRSSARSEDKWDSSNAGGYDSILDVDGTDGEAVKAAIEKVVASYGSSPSHHDQILVQEFLKQVMFSGVVFTRTLETGSAYYRFNFDDKSTSTESVTSGFSQDLRTFIVSKSNPMILEKIEPKLYPVLEAILELESILGFDKLDIEFAVTKSGHVHIFQVRPITVDHSEYEFEDSDFYEYLNECQSNFERFGYSTPSLLGNKKIFGNMPDWNPAEIIGIRPKPLAFSLYRSLITNEVWANQRAEYGYRDLGSCPLIRSFLGQPYVDVRASLNSFIPKNLSDGLAEKLVNAYSDILENNPQFHDKLEFEVAFTIWTPDFDELARNRLDVHGFDVSEIKELGRELKAILMRALDRLEDDVEGIKILTQRRIQLAESGISEIDKALVLLDDCRRFGTLAFAHAARAGFVASTLLKSLVNSGFISEGRLQTFMESIETVAKEFERDKNKYARGELEGSEMLAKYGHLRPGTYELSNSAYWENPDLYFSSTKGSIFSKSKNFAFTEKEETVINKMLKSEGFSNDAKGLFQYFRKAIELREFVKFEFTKNLSQALDEIVNWSGLAGISRNDVSFLEVDDLEKYKVGAKSINELNQSILTNKKYYRATQLLELPSLITNSNDFLCFERFSAEANFITTYGVDGEIFELLDDSAIGLSEKIVLIPQADPGYDWLFSQGIKGLVTKYGGANSHMAIRSAEMGLPAAIGIGEHLYEILSGANRVQLDCAGKQIRVLS